MELTSSSARCEKFTRVLQGRQGEIQSSALPGWRPRQLNCTWVIMASLGEPVILSFSQFSVRCGMESLSLTPVGRHPISICGSQLPQPMELLGNITVTYNFIPRIYSMSGFHLSYMRASGPCAPGEFECFNGRCLPSSWHCNGQSECLVGGSDELDCGEIYPWGMGTTTMGRDWESVAGQGDSHRLPNFHPQRNLTPEIRNTPLPVPTGPCGGVQQGFFGWFSPPQSSMQSLSCVWTVDPKDSRPLRLDLQMLELGPGDTIVVTDSPQGQGNIIKTITCASNYKVVQVVSRTGLLSLTYRTLPGSEGQGFNATYRISGYCLPWEGVCRGPSGGCYTSEQRCDGRWDCPDSGSDEEGCGGCPRDKFACGGATAQRPGGAGRYVGRPVCYPPKERCNYQLYCADGSDERDCTVCQPGTFHCDTDRCVFESWRCDGQVDCKDGTDELNCTATLPRKVITAATVGSLVCGLLLVIAMGCTCKLYSLRTREYSMFAPISRQEAEIIQQQAPPSYGQLIAQGVIPPVEDFPTENPNESSALTLRGILQLLRQDAGPSPRRRRRPRFVRRAIRRMRRWGLIPRATPRSTQTSSSSSPQPEVGPASSEALQSSPGSLSREGAHQLLPQKQGLVPQTEQLPPVPPALPPPDSAQPPPASNPSTPFLCSSSVASLLHSLGLNISFFRLTGPPPVSAPASSFTSSSDDEVLLIPLSEDVPSDQDVPMLT
ncbi:low-density lipoprotein receptor-related protein 10-like [Scleropages formosus]|nr:low-density lipoprotein receptor-related protein 10-like [Scleropages formosus]